MDRYIIYGIEKCSYCRKAREALKQRSIEVIWVDLNSDPTHLDEIKKYYNYPTVPIILKNNLDSGLMSFVGGHSDLLESLDV